jgi:hypothetical protein
VHHRLIAYAGDSLQERLPAGLRARIEQRVFLETNEDKIREIIPDVSVVEHPRQRGAPAGAAEGVAVAEPTLIHLGVEEVKEGYLEIVDVLSGNRVITVIEFLSPTNKVPGEGQKKYLAKQSEVIAAEASLVEIDLTRTGRRVFSVPSGLIPGSLRTTYQICIRRGWKHWIGELYRAPIRERLPVIPIPLRQTDADVPLDLQALVDLCYEHGRYDDTDYRAEPDPPLDPPDAAWADAHLRAQGRR